MRKKIILQNCIKWQQINWGGGWAPESLIIGGQSESESCKFSTGLLQQKGRDDYD